MKPVSWFRRLQLQSPLDNQGDMCYTLLAVSFMSSAVLPDMSRIVYGIYLAGGIDSKHGTGADFL